MDVCNYGLLATCMRSGACALGFGLIYFSAPSVGPMALRLGCTKSKTSRICYIVYLFENMKCIVPSHTNVIHRLAINIA